jgi:hypothetical protein
MLRSLNSMLEYRLAAPDGDAGHVQDFLFDDETWVVEYLVVETGSRQSSRKVLILPFALGASEWESRRLAVFLTCDQVRSSLAVRAETPVSVQRKAGLKGPSSHLRSIREVIGYSIHAGDDEIGTVKDLIVEDTLWGVHDVVVELKRAPERLVLISHDAIQGISWKGKAAWVTLLPDEIERHPDFDPTAPVNHDSSDGVYDYYGHPLATSR